MDYHNCPPVFDTTFLETSNSSTSLSDTRTDSEISFSQPTATSSPCYTRPKSNSDNYSETCFDLPMRILVVNCQSIKSTGKKALLQNLIDSTQADIIIGTESWLDGSIKSSEVFSSNFKAYDGIEIWVLRVVSSLSNTRVMSLKN